MLDMLERALEAIRLGNVDAAERLLKLVLSENLPPRFKAIAHIALAQIQPTREKRIEHYRHALSFDPNNQEATNGLAQSYNEAFTEKPISNPARDGFIPMQNLPIDMGDDLAQVVNVPPLDPTASSLPLPLMPDSPNDYSNGYTPTNGYTSTNYTPVNGYTPTNGYTPPPMSASVNGASPTPPPSPVVRRYHQVVGVLNAPNGNGSAFFVSQDGLLATTRHVVGGAVTVTILLDDGEQVPAQVVRSYLDYDLAFIQVNIHQHYLTPHTSISYVPENAGLGALNYRKEKLSGHCRATKNVKRAGWFPTTFKTFADSGGNPVYDDNNLLVGMLTRNHSSTSKEVFGLHIHQIHNCLTEYLQTRAQMVNAQYCPSCGNLSMANPSVGAYYCEWCASVLMTLRGQNLFANPINRYGNLYSDYSQAPCPKCSSKVGSYNGLCLRCGHKNG